MHKTLIKNARIINDGKITEGDVLVMGHFIESIDTSISAKPDYKVIDAEGNYLLPGVIDDQVHFREPGLTHKGDIKSESNAAIAGGITSFIEQPNTVPNAVTQELLEQKYQIAAQNSFANYGFMMGGTNNNLEELLRTNSKEVPGIKLFLGSSTGNMLVDDEQALENIFTNISMLIAVHCEDETTVKNNLLLFQEQYGENIPVSAHPLIRSEEACWLSSSKAVALAKKTGARLHVFHLSTAKELSLFSNKLPLEKKKITAEVCIHHLWFSDQDYEAKGNLIKWNPAVKTSADREALWKALNDDVIDVIATDHAPHTLEEKSKKYGEAPSGGPLVQHALVAMFEANLQGKITLEKIVTKMCHSPADIFKIDKRGYIREGYYADLVLVNPAMPWNVKKENILYKCGWSPLEGQTFRSRVTHTFVNGALVYQQGKNLEVKNGMRMVYNR
ncbi:MAG: dihydroorotase [Flavobacterium sp.]